MDLTQKQIKTEVKKTRLDIKNKKSLLLIARQNLRKAEDDVHVAWDYLYRLQSKCKHEYPKQNKYPVMGKGICKNCGVNDY